MACHKNGGEALREALDKIDHLQWYQPSTVIIGDKGGKQMDIISVLAQLGLSLDPDNHLGRTSFWLRCSPGKTLDVNVRLILDRLPRTGQRQTSQQPSDYSEAEYEILETPSVIQLHCSSDATTLPKLPIILRYAQLEILNRTTWKKSDGRCPPLFDDISHISHHSLESVQTQIFANSPPFVPNTLMLDITLPQSIYVSVMALPYVLVCPGRDSDQYHIPALRNLAVQYIRQEETTLLLALPPADKMPNCESLALIRSSGRCSQVTGIRVLSGSGMGSNIEASDSESWGISGGIMQFNQQHGIDSDRVFTTLANIIRESNNSAILKRLRHRAQQAGAETHTNFHELPEHAKLPLRRLDIGTPWLQGSVVSWEDEEGDIAAELEQLQETVWLNGDWKQS